LFVTDEVVQDIDRIPSRSISATQGEVISRRENNEFVQDAVRASNGSISGTQGMFSNTITPIRLSQYSITPPARNTQLQQSSITLKLIISFV
jgi:hypothetical protein